MEVGQTSVMNQNHRAGMNYEAEADERNCPPSMNEAQALHHADQHRPRSLRNRRIRQRRIRTERKVSMY